MKQVLMEKVNARAKKDNTSLYKCPTIICDDCNREVPKSATVVFDIVLTCCKCAIKRISFAK